MATFMSILTALPTIWKFWGEFKVLFEKLKKMKSDADKRKFLADLNKASDVADETGDTSGYEDIIRRGKF
jgi:hypothetical protein